MSKHQKQTDEDNYKEARAHLQQSWRRWLAGDNSSSRQAAGPVNPMPDTPQTPHTPRVIAFNRFGPLQDQVYQKLPKTAVDALPRVS